MSEEATLVTLARKMLAAYSRELTARSVWVNQSDPHSDESRRMFDTVMAREAETREAALAVGRIVFPQESAQAEE